MLLQVDTSEATKFVSKLGLLRRIFRFRSVRKLEAFGEATLGAYIRAVGFGGRPYLIRRSGGMATSVVVKPSNNGEVLGYSISSRHPGIRVQMHGAVITPKIKKSLTIPLASSYVGGFRIYPSPVNPNEFKVIRRGGKGYLVNIIRHAVTHRLVKSARIPARLNLQKLTQEWWEKRYRPEVERIIGKSISSAAVGFGSTN